MVETTVMGTIITVDIDTVVGVTILAIDIIETTITTTVTMIEDLTTITMVVTYMVVNIEMDHTFIKDVPIVMGTTIIEVTDITKVNALKL